jgi:hypothetical protein|tara:strand:+ start:334 stop:849 length:516 start_codon:yes stop_codon:yes gene_type:complete
MAQEFFINSQELEDKIRQLLPSQGGAGAGFDLTASTQIIPIIDLTESAEGSSLRQDLQTAISFDGATVFDINNATATIINNTGYYRIIGTITMRSDVSTAQNVDINITDGASTKKVYGSISTNGGNTYCLDFDKIIFLSAGDSCTVTCSAQARFIGSSRQIATIDGVLVNP